MQLARSIVTCVHICMNKLGYGFGPVGAMCIILLHGSRTVAHTGMAQNTGMAFINYNFAAQQNI